MSDENKLEKLVDKHIEQIESELDRIEVIDAKNVSIEIKYDRKAHYMRGKSL